MKKKKIHVLPTILNYQNINSYKLLLKKDLGFRNKLKFSFIFSLFLYGAKKCNAKCMLYVMFYIITNFKKSYTQIIFHVVIY